MCLATYIRPFRKTRPRGCSPNAPGAPAWKMPATSTCTSRAANIRKARAIPGSAKTSSSVTSTPISGCGARSCGARKKSKAGVNLHLSDIERISSKAVDARYKNFHWADLIQSQYQAYEAGRDDAVLRGPDGALAEGPGFNIWVVKDGVCATPDANCLMGMSRRSALELCEMEGIPCETRAIHLDELRDADEAFATSSAGGIMPVTAIDDKPLGNGAPGILTTRLADSYWRRREAGWCGTRIDDLLAA